MAKIPEERPTTFAEFVGLVEKHCNSRDALWYRGCGQSSYKLLPTLYRHRTVRSPEELAKLEHDLMVRFRQRSVPFHSRSLGDDWDAIFFMQHHRVPTRLLDWTENPLVALYFAVMAAPCKVSKDNIPQFTKSASVWVLDPVAWNRHALSHQSFDGGILAPGDDALKGYTPAQSFVGMNNCPVALYGTHNSPRIVAQRGVFTIFGQTTKPMEQLYEKESFPEGCLTKLVLDSSHIGVMRDSVLRNGITESVVFPDLDGLAQEIRRAFKFEV